MSPFLLEEGVPYQGGSTGTDRARRVGRGLPDAQGTGPGRPASRTTHSSPCRASGARSAVLEPSSSSWTLGVVQG